MPPTVAQKWSSQPSISVAPAVPGTVIAVLDDVNPPLPSSPLELDPQHFTLLATIAQKVSEADARAVGAAAPAPEAPDTMTGVRLFELEPLPRRPLAPAPKQRTVAVTPATMAQVALSATATVFSPSAMPARTPEVGVLTTAVDVPVA
jgi:hypothetical protein